MANKEPSSIATEFTEIDSGAESGKARIRIIGAVACGAALVAVGLGSLRGCSLPEFPITVDQPPARVDITTDMVLNELTFPGSLNLMQASGSAVTNVMVDFNSPSVDVLGSTIIPSKTTGSIEINSNREGDLVMSLDSTSRNPDNFKPNAAETTADTYVISIQTDPSGTEYVQVAVNVKYINIDRQNMTSVKGESYVSPTGTARLTSTFLHDGLGLSEIGIGAGDITDIAFERSCGAAMVNTGLVDDAIKYSLSLLTSSQSQTILDTFKQKYPNNDQVIKDVTETLDFVYDAKNWRVVYTSNPQGQGIITANQTLADIPVMIQGPVNNLQIAKAVYLNPANIVFGENTFIGTGATCELDQPLLEKLSITSSAAATYSPKPQLVEKP